MVALLREDVGNWDEKQARGKEVAGNGASYNAQVQQVVMEEGKGTAARGGCNAGRDNDNGGTISRRNGGFAEGG